MHCPLVTVARRESGDIKMKWQNPHKDKVRVDGCFLISNQLSMLHFLKKGKIYSILHGDNKSSHLKRYIPQRLRLHCAWSRAASPSFLKLCLYRLQNDLNRKSICKGKSNYHQLRSTTNDEILFIQNNQ